MVDFDMDCSQTEQGWFELKSLLNNGTFINRQQRFPFQRMKSNVDNLYEIGWESDISQIECEGESNGKAPFVSKNHVARCGYINKFDFGANSCQINTFPSK